MRENCYVVLFFLKSVCVRVCEQMPTNMGKILLNETHLVYGEMLLTSGGEAG